MWKERGVVITEEGRGETKEGRWKERKEGGREEKKEGKGRE